MISKIRKWRRSRKVMTALAIAGVFLLSASFAVVFNHQGNSGERVAEAASRVNRQVDDTQQAFTEIKDLIPEEQRMEAVAPGGFDHQPTSGSAPPQPQLPALANEPPVSDQEPQPVTGDGYAVGINPASSDASTGASGYSSVDDNGNDDADASDEKKVPPTLTFSQQAREVQGDEMLTLY